MNASRRAFLGAMLIAPVVGLAIMKRGAQQERQLIASREDFYREARAAWEASGEYKEIASRANGERYAKALAKSLRGSRYALMLELRHG